MENLSKCIICQSDLLTKGEFATRYPFEFRATKSEHYNSPFGNFEVKGVLCLNCGYIHPFADDSFKKFKEIEILKRKEEENTEKRKEEENTEKRKEEENTEKRKEEENTAELAKIFATKEGKTAKELTEIFATKEEKTAAELTETFVREAKEKKSAEDAKGCLFLIAFTLILCGLMALFAWPR